MYRISVCIEMYRECEYGSGGNTLQLVQQEMTESELAVICLSKSMRHKYQHRVKCRFTGISHLDDQFYLHTNIIVCWKVNTAQYNTSTCSSKDSAHWESATMVCQCFSWGMDIWLMWQLAIPCITVVVYLTTSLDWVPCGAVHTKSHVVLASIPHVHWSLWHNVQ